jgi:hypothetical protein
MEQTSPMPLTGHTRLIYSDGRRRVIPAPVVPDADVEPYHLPHMAPWTDDIGKLAPKRRIMHQRKPRQWPYWLIVIGCFAGIGVMLAWRG